jgi:hypothetical protein
MHQTIACIDGLGGCGLVRLTILPIWKILYDVRQDHQKLESGDLPYTT